MIRVEMEDWDGRRYWAEYEHFRIGDETDHFRCETLRTWKQFVTSGTWTRSRGGQHDDLRLSTPPPFFTVL